MKKYFFLSVISLLIASCSEDIQSTEIHQESQIYEKPEPRLFVHDSIRKHPYTIPFLTWEAYEPYNYYIIPGLTKIRFDDFTVKVDGEFEVVRNQISGNRIIYENVGSYFQGRNFWIDSKDKKDSYKIELGAAQSIQEQFNQAWYDDPKFDSENWFNNRFQEKEISEFYLVKDSANFYRMTWTNSFFEKRFNQTHETIDTLRHYPGEIGGTTATMYYKEKMCTYFVEYGILKISRTTPEGIKSEHLIEISYSYGC